MRVNRFALILILMMLLVVLAFAHYMPALRHDPSQGLSASPTADPELPVITARPQPAMNLTDNLMLPDLSGPSFNFPRIPDGSSMNIKIPTLNPTPTPTPVQPCPTPMQPMKPMDPWEPMAAMTPMLSSS
jgi:hypothetical protein